MKKPEVLSPLMNTNTAPRSARISKEDAQKRIREMYERDHELVTGIFENKENPATNGGLGMLQFGFKKYKEDPFVFYELLHGERYTLPRMVVMHLTNGCYYKEYQRLPGEFGNNDIRQGANPEGRMITDRQQMARKVHRYGWKTLEFVDDSDFKPVDLVEVTRY